MSETNRIEYKRELTFKGSIHNFSVNTITDYTYQNNPGNFQ